MTTEATPTNGHAKEEPVLPAPEVTDAWTDILAVLTKANGEPLTSQEIAELSGRHMVTVNEQCKKHRRLVMQGDPKGKARTYLLREATKPKAKAKTKARTKKVRVKGKSNIQKSRDTIARVHAILAESARPLSAFELHDRMPDIVMASIYSALARSKEVAVVGHGDHGVKLFALKISTKKKKVDKAEAVSAIERFVKGPVLTAAPGEEPLLELTRRIIALEAELAAAKDAFKEALRARYQ